MSMITRRGALAGTAAVAAVTAALPAAVAATPVPEAPGENPVLLDLWRRWQEARAAVDRIQDAHRAAWPDPAATPREVNIAYEERFGDADSVWVDIEDQLADVPAWTMAGAVIKLRILAYWESKHNWEDIDTDKKLALGALDVLERLAAEG